jgi:hypothetical protein
MTVAPGSTFSNTKDLSDSEEAYNLLIWQQWVQLEAGSRGSSAEASALELVDPTDPPLERTAARGSGRRPASLHLLWLAT